MSELKSETSSWNASDWWTSRLHVHLFFLLFFSRRNWLSYQFRGQDYQLLGVGAECPFPFLQLSLWRSLVRRCPCPLPFLVASFSHSVFKYWDGERALWHWVVLAGQGGALPARNARHSGGVGGWAASSSSNVLDSNYTGMKCMYIAPLSLEITITCILQIKRLTCSYSVFTGSSLKNIKNLKNEFFWFFFFKKHL